VFFSFGRSPLEFFTEFCEGCSHLVVNRFLGYAQLFRYTAVFFAFKFVHLKNPAASFGEALYGVIDGLNRGVGVFRQFVVEKLQRLEFDFLFKYERILKMTVALFDGKPVPQEINALVPHYRIEPCVKRSIDADCVPVFQYIRKDILNYIFRIFLSINIFDSKAKQARKVTHVNIPQAFIVSERKFAM
jgi:hypothetical protein